MSYIHVCLCDGLKQIFYNIFKKNDLDYAFFLGTPGKHQKIVIQVSYRRSILGYCKVTCKSYIYNNFLKESDLLKSLQGKGIVNIPNALFVGVLPQDPSVGIFVQSTSKSVTSYTVHELTELHYEFLNELYRCTVQTHPLEKTDFYKSLMSLEDYLYLLQKDTEVVERAIQLIKNRWMGKKVQFSAYHGDFTPWNTYIEDGKLFVFDWEYGAMSYPPMLDLFHFFTQSCIYEKMLNAEQILVEYQMKKSSFEVTLNGLFPSVDFGYLCYLLDVLSLYLNREQGNFSGDVKRCVETWIKLIERLTNLISDILD